MATIVTTVTYTASGTTATFTIPFEYLSKSHVHVYIDGTETTAFTFSGTYSILMNTVPTSGTLIKIERVTPYDEQMIVWLDGSILKSEDMNSADLQMLYVLQENMYKSVYVYNRFFTMDAALTAMTTLINTTTTTLNNLVTTTTATFNSMVSTAQATINTKVATAQATVQAAIDSINAKVTSAINSLNSVLRLSQEILNSFTTKYECLARFWTVNYIDGLACTTYSSITKEYDGGTSSTSFSSYDTIYGMTYNPSLWYSLNAEVVEALNVYTISSISPINSNGEITITVSNVALIEDGD